jgi:long-chain acyl-CoA synthetase
VRCTPSDPLDNSHANIFFVDRLKLKRPQSARAFREQIDAMYQEIAEQEPATKSKL